MKLYYAPMSCSIAVRILLRELGIESHLSRVDLAAKTTDGGAPFWPINPKRQVPALELDNGEILTEVGPVLQHLAGADPQGRFIAAPTSTDRRRQLEWLSFLSGELHKAVFYVIFHPDAPDGAKAFARALSKRPMDILSEHLRSRAFLTERYSIADMLLVALLCWCEYAGLDFTQWPVLVEYRARLARRDAIRSTIAIERAEFAAQS